MCNIYVYIHIRISENRAFKFERDIGERKVYEEIM